MKHITVALFGLLLMAPGMARGDHRDLALFASPALIDSGLVKFLVPRFSLKTGVGVHVEPLDQVTPNRAAPNGVTLQEVRGAGVPILHRAGQVYGVVQGNPDDKPASRFTAWLLSDIGQSAIEQFTPEDGPAFTGVASAAPVAPPVRLSGNAQSGEAQAYAKCARCHVIGPRNRMKGIGSTPSFAVLRNIDNWLDRFRGFYKLNPHPSFTQITGITAPFDPALPPPISPLVLTPQELDDIIAYTNGIKPADLGAPLVHQ